MKVAIMQPYLFPYIGYFQLINSVDKFVIYDSIKYTKKGWINRNRILSNGKDEYISLPLRKDSDYLNIKERYLADTSGEEIEKILRKIKFSYSKAPHFNDVYPITEQILRYPQKNLFEFIYNSIIILCKYFNINTKIIISSTIDIDQNYKSEDKVIALCNALNAVTYINPIGGTELYSTDKFLQNNLELLFIKSNSINYKQFNNEFIPWLSIIDVMMFNKKNDIERMICEEYNLIK